VIAMLPTEDEVHALVKTGDVFRYAIVGFSAIEAAFEELIVESLVTSHRLELRRISFELKVDFAIGLGVFPAQSKPLLTKLSKIRNYYAHEFSAQAEYCSPAELKSCFSAAQRSLAGDYYAGAETFREAMRVGFISAYYEALRSVEGVRAEKKRRAEARLEIEAVQAATAEYLAQSQAKVAPQPGQDALVAEKSKELETLIAQKKKEILAGRAIDSGVDPTESRCE
jgi:hypothetical protein